MRWMSWHKDFWPCPCLFSIWLSCSADGDGDTQRVMVKSATWSPKMSTGGIFLLLPGTVGDFLFACSTTTSWGLGPVSLQRGHPVLASWLRAARQKAPKEQISPFPCSSACLCVQACLWAAIRLCNHRGRDGCTGPTTELRRFGSNESPGAQGLF